MSKYETVRKEFLNLQNDNALTSKRYPAIEIFLSGMGLTKLPHGFTGIEVHYRPDGSKICEKEFYGGAATGCARYYSKNGDIGGQDYYRDGGVFCHHVFT
jgi:antitoxin component YwqK of YwqJK toxin-antitoxin module